MYVCEKAQQKTQHIVYEERYCPLTGSEAIFIKFSYKNIAELLN